MLKSKKNLLKIVAIFTIILITIFGFTGCKRNKKNDTSDEKSYLQPITDYFEGIKSKDLSRVAKAKNSNIFGGALWFLIYDYSLMGSCD